MLDNLRDQASFEEEKNPPNSKKTREPRQRRQYRSVDEITHMTASQRFALAFMLLIIVTLLGTLLLIFYGKIVPAFLY
jgi:uncharacterized membrane protein